MLKKMKPRPEEQIPCHSLFSAGIICGPHRGSFAVRGHLRSNLGIISGLGIICGRGSFAALYNTVTVSDNIQWIDVYYNFLFRYTLKQNNMIKSSECKCPRRAYKCSHAAAPCIYGIYNLSRTDVECSWKKRNAPDISRKSIAEMFPPTKPGYYSLTLKAKSRRSRSAVFRTPSIWKVHRPMLTVKHSAKTTELGIYQSQQWKS